MIGFNNKEIKKILTVLKKAKIRTNIELIDIIGEEKYSETEQMIKFSE